MDDSSLLLFHRLASENYEVLKSRYLAAQTLHEQILAEMMDRDMLTGDKNEPRT